MSMAKLWEINAGLRKRSDEGDLPDCNVCNSPSKLGCAVCKSRYCSKVRSILDIRLQLCGD